MCSWIIGNGTGVLNIVLLLIAQCSPRIVLRANSRAITCGFVDYFPNFISPR